MSASISFDIEIVVEFFGAPNSADGNTLHILFKFEIVTFLLKLFDPARKLTLVSRIHSNVTLRMSERDKMQAGLHSRSIWFIINTLRFKSITLLTYLLLTHSHYIYH